MIEELKQQFQIYLSILDFLERHKNKYGISEVSQQMIAEHIDVSTTLISQKIKVLIKYGALKKVGPGKYKVLHNDIMYTPYATVSKLIYMHNAGYLDNLNYREQADLLGVDMTEIQRTRAYLNKFIRNQEK